MGKLANFFSKLGGGDKFQGGGQGRRLNESRIVNEPTRDRNSPSPPANRLAPSECAKKAADAALSRISAKQVPKKSVYQRKVEAENARREKELKGAEEMAARLSSTKLFSESQSEKQKVQFCCHDLLGDDVHGTYSEIDEMIEKALVEESKQDPGAAFTLLIIRSIETSTSSTDDNPQAIRDKRRQNFIKIIRNIVENPTEENFRRLRKGNTLVSDLLRLPFAEQFFETCGFREVELPVAAPSQSLSAGSSDIDETAPKTEKFLIFPGPPNEEQSLHLLSILELLESGQLVTPKLYRDTLVLKAGGAETRGLGREDLPAEFFLVSLEDVRRMNETLRRNAEEKPMLTREMREKLKARDHRVYRYARIRVRLPFDDLFIQGTFQATESLKDVRQWVTSCLADSATEFSLWAPPGQVKAAGRPATARVLLDELEDTASLADLGLAPSALLTLALKPCTPASSGSAGPHQPPPGVPLLLPELEAKVQRLL